MTFTLLLVKDIPELPVGFTLQSRLRQPAVDFYLALVTDIPEAAVCFTLQSRLRQPAVNLYLAFSERYT